MSTLKKGGSKPTQSMMGGEHSMTKTMGGDGGASGYGQQVYGAGDQQHAAAGGNMIDVKGGVVGQCGGNAPYKGGMKLSLRNLFKNPLGKKKRRSRKNTKSTKRKGKKGKKSKSGKTHRRRR